MDKFEIYKAEKKDLSTLYNLINGLAIYEKRPQDMTGTEEKLNYWVFEKNIATAYIAKVNDEIAGYALYYPVFGSFACNGNVHLEDLYLEEKYRGKGFGKKFMQLLAREILNQGYSNLEWGCLDWNEPSIAFYKNIGATQETGRYHYNFSKSELEELAGKLN